MTTVRVHVTTYDQQPAPEVHVAAMRDGQIVTEAVTDERGQASLTVDRGELQVRVEVDGLAPEERLVRVGDTPRVERFILGPEGLPFYYRGTVRVPFVPVEGAVGVLLGPAGPTAQETFSGDQSTSTAARAEAVASTVDGSVIRADGNFAQSHVAVLSVPEDGDSGPGLDHVIRRLNDHDDVAHAGSILELHDEHASFLTEQVIARFHEGVDQATIAAIAERHDLVDQGAIAALGPVHRLRFTGLPTSALLDAVNALAAQPEVEWAEPDLVHTVQHDAVTPVDFLFAEQWDHKVINTPDAWQALRDVDPTRTDGDPDIVIAILDTGVELTHPEFRGTVSNGEPKVYAQYDFTEMVHAMEHFNSVNSDHGTACASAATAQTERALDGVGIGMAGVAGNCRLIAVRIGLGPESKFAEMYLWVAGFPTTRPDFPAQITPGADVISSSYVWPGSDNKPISGAMQAVFDTLTDKGRDGRGAVLFFSAGNDNKDLVPRQATLGR